MKFTRILASSAAFLALVMPVTVSAQEKGTIEGLHHWTSESEVKALNVILQGLKDRGYGWQDSAVGGQSGANATQALRTRLAAGNPPAVMQFLGFEGVNWAEEGVLRDLSDMEKAGNWDAVIAPAALPFVKSEDGGFFAVPINMHRTNWVWANKKIFDDAGLKQPKSWQELVDMGPALKEKGIIPLAASDEAWQVGKLFDAIVMDLNGPEYFQKAVIELDDEALSGPQMLATFEMLRKVRGLVDNNFNGRDWSVATGMVINGQAAMQVMGDWAKGEFLGKGMKPGQDFLCFPTPTAIPNYTFNFDAFGMFKVSDAKQTAGQDALAETIMDPKIQHDFNAIKGSIPARSDVSVDDLDQCAKDSYRDRESAIKAGTMFGSITQGFAVQPQFAAVFNEVAAKFFVTDMSAEDGVKMLVEGIDNAR